MKSVFNRLNYFLLSVIVAESLIIFWFIIYDENLAKDIASSLSRQGPASAPLAVSSPFHYVFNSISAALPETGSMSESWSPYWWLNSGGYLYISESVGRTVQNELPRFSIWRLAYARSNPIDTDQGYHPQNIFRLITRSRWQNFQQETYFRITGDNLSKSPNRNASNGLFLMSRYQDGNNLYYAGVRVDGLAVIKKKFHGDYSSLGLEKVIVNKGEYDSENNPNLLPKNIWIGLRSEIRNNVDGSVDLRLFVDFGKTGNWLMVLDVKDNGRNFGSVISEGGFAGLRTDFMDVEFSGYKIVSL
jgi:hypothetical protein